MMNIREKKWGGLVGCAVQKGTRQWVIGGQENVTIVGMKELARQMQIDIRYNFENTNETLFHFAHSLENPCLHALFELPSNWRNLESEAGRPSPSLALLSDAAPHADVWTAE